MEFDTDDWADSKATDMNDLLELTIAKLGYILKTFLNEPDKTIEDSEDLLAVHSLTYEMACKVSGWFERKFPTIVPWLSEDSSRLQNMTLLSSKSPWDFTLTYAHAHHDLFENIPPKCLQNVIEIPKTGTFLCCSYRKKMFRGFLLDVLSYQRLKVLNIDTNEVFMVCKSEAYHLPADVCEMHALCVHCTLAEDDEVVQNVWSEDLEAIFVRTLKECSLQIEIVRRVRSSPPKYLVKLVGFNKEGRSVNLSDWLLNTLIPDMKQHIPLLSAKEELCYFLKDESIEPYSCIQQPITSEVNGLHASKEQLMSILCSVPPPHERLPSIACASNYSEHSNSLCSEDERRPGKSPLLKDSNVDTLGNGVSVDAPALLNGQMKKENDANDIEIPVTLKVTNKLSLPGVGERVNVVITHILPSLAFYVLLEGRYSDVIDNGFIESYTTLINRMNNPASCKSYEELPGPPTTGQLVAFRRNASTIWSRGVVTEIGSSSATVFNPDLGDSETVPTRHLRVISSRDTVLPYQAVLTFLHDLYLTEDAGTSAKDFFSELIALKKLHAVVRNLDRQSPTMGVDLYTGENVHINEVLVSSGLCKRVENSPRLNSNP